MGSDGLLGDLVCGDSLVSLGQLENQTAQASRASEIQHPALGGYW